MKQLKNNIYENLSFQERIIASVEAKARGDDNEIKRLIKTCPKRSYRCTDSNYSDRMDRLFLMQIAIECDLMRHALNYLCFTCDEGLQSFTDTHTAWAEFLSDQGIKIERMDEIAQEMRHPIIENMLKILNNTPNLEYVSTYKEAMNDLYQKNL